MKNVFFYLLVVFAIVALYGFAYAKPAGEENPGKKIFVEAKCNGCHAVEKAGIEAKMKKKTNPDLSTVGSKQKPDFIKKYIMKQEKMNDKLHPVAFKGTDGDLAKLVQWLGSLKETTKK